MTRTSARRRYLRIAPFLTVPLLVGLPSTSAGAAPAVAPAPPLAPAAAPAMSAGATSAVTLKPGWLPAGYELLNSVTEEVNGVTFSTTRYTDLQPDGTAGPGVIYLEVARGGTGELAGPGEHVTPVVVGGRKAVYLDTGAIREYRFAGADRTVALVGALGTVSDTDLTYVVDDVVGLTELGTPDPGIGTDPILGEVNVDVTDPGTGGGSDNSMAGTGVYTNDWSTDGANATISKYATHVYKGNIVGVWQAILYAEQAFMKDWFPYRRCDVDGYFGEYAANATMWYQANIAGTANDGIVGPATWGAADNRLGYVSGQLKYRGKHYVVNFTRSSSAPYLYRWGWNGSYHYTGYYTVEFTRYSC